MNDCIFYSVIGPCNGTIGIVSLETEGVWRSVLEREVSEHFHSSCWEETLKFQLNAGACFCLFCNKGVIIASGDIIVGRDTEGNLSRYYWFHRECWDYYGIALGE